MSKFFNEYNLGDSFTVEQLEEHCKAHFEEDEKDTVKTMEFCLLKEQQKLVYKSAAMFAFSLIEEVNSELENYTHDDDIYDDEHDEITDQEKLDKLLVDELSLRRIASLLKEGNIKEALYQLSCVHDDLYELRNVEV
jgi:hypothetical protein